MVVPNRNRKYGWTSLRSDTTVDAGLHDPHAVSGYDDSHFAR